MTSREERIENYNDALFALLMDELAQSEGARLIEENEALNRNDDAAVPPELHQRCMRAIRVGLLRQKAISSLLLTGRLMLRLAAAVFVTVALFTAAFAASSSFRAGTLNLLMDIDEDLVQWSSGPETEYAVKTPTAVLSWLPDDYACTEETHGAFDTTLTYQNSAGDTLCVSLLVGIESRKTQADKENATHWESFSLHGLSAVAIQKGGQVSVSWYDPEAAVMVDIRADALSIEQLKQVAEKIIFVS